MRVCSLVIVRPGRNQWYTLRIGQLPRLNFAEVSYAVLGTKTPTVIGTVHNGLLRVLGLPQEKTKLPYNLGAKRLIKKFNGHREIAFPNPRGTVIFVQLHALDQKEIVSMDNSMAIMLIDILNSPPRPKGIASAQNLFTRSFYKKRSDSSDTKILMTKVAKEVIEAYSKLNPEDKQKWQEEHEADKKRHHKEMEKWVKERPEELDPPALPPSVYKLFRDEQRSAQDEKNEEDDEQQKKKKWKKWSDLTDKERVHFHKLETKAVKEWYKAVKKYYERCGVPMPERVEIEDFKNAQPGAPPARDEPKKGQKRVFSSSSSSKPVSKPAAGEPDKPQPKKKKRKTAETTCNGSDSGSMDLDMSGAEARDKFFDTITA